MLALAVVAALAAPARADKVDDLVRDLKTGSDYKVRLSAALSLAKLGDKRAIPAFVIALNDKDKTVRGAAAVSLGKLVDAATSGPQKAQVEKVWQESYKGLEKVPIVIDTDAMVRYGASATPTFALIDRKGVVRLYAPTRLSEVELSRKIEEVLNEAP